MRITAGVALLGAAFAGACAANSHPVPVFGSNKDVAALVGEWSGEYRNMEAGRSGSILFRLGKGSDTAVGDVLMIPSGVAHNHADGLHPQKEFIRIAFVRASSGRVHGFLDPYEDPVCGCTLSTMFEGVLHGDTIAGAFMTRHVEGGILQEGSWRAVRAGHGVR